MSLNVDHLCKSFGSAKVLSDVTFELAEGEILGVIGPSGGGKSTLLRCLDLLEPIDSGHIAYNLGTNFEVKAERRVSEDMACDLRKQIGFVFQGFNLWEEKSVLENLILAPTIVWGLSREESTNTARELCERFGLAEKLHSRVWQLSGGQKQRVALIRAVMIEPKILLLDEVTSALDPVLTVDVMESVRNLKSNGMSMIIITHHLEFASSLCDRIMFISSGHIIQIDKPAVLVNSPVNDEVDRFLTILKKAR